jgi:DNA primase
MCPLKQKGRNWQGLCPFHQEKTPSFYVDPATQTFKCFGCGASGDVFTFISRYENMSFVEAAEWLARRAGLQFARRGQEEAGRKSERDQIFEINAVACDYFRTMLQRVPAAKEYLHQRGLTQEALTRFQIGYAPDSWDALVSFLRARRLSLQIAETAGLVVRASSGDMVDMFRHRIIFPIHDEQERIVGFGGRALGDMQPKYLNTGETPVFAKSRLLYGLPFARRKIAAAGYTLLMEGYMDVVAAHQADFSNALATLGTSLTEEHARKTRPPGSRRHPCL